MFDIGYLIKNAWKILWRYKVLWVFALLLALSGGAGNFGSSGGGGGGTSSWTADMPSQRGDWFSPHWSYNFDDANAPQWLKEAGTWFQQTVEPMFATEAQAIRTAFIFVAIIIGISLLIGLLLALVRYPSETAVMRLVDEHHHSGNRVKFKEGWKLGWTNRAWKLFLVDLLIGAPAFTIIISLVAVLGLLIWRMAEVSSMHVPAGAIIGVIFIGLFFLLFFLFMALVSLLRQYVARYVTLEGAGVGEAFKRGWQMFKNKFWGTVVLGLVQIGLGIAFGIALMITFFLLIPAYAIMALPGALVAALPGALAYVLADLSLPMAVAIAVGVLVAMPFFFAVVFSPLSFLGGMFAVFLSNIWTLAFRTLKPQGTPPPVDGEIPPALTFEAPQAE
jgi:hypothetical protein